MDQTTFVTLFIVAIALIILVSGIVAVANGAKITATQYKGSGSDGGYGDGWHRSAGEGFIK